MYVYVCVCVRDVFLACSSLHASFAQSLSPNNIAYPSRRRKKMEKREEKKNTDTNLRRAVAFRFPGRNQSPLNRGGAEIRAPLRAVASIPPRLAPQSMPCPASCFFDCLFFVLQLIFSPLSLSPAGWRQNSVSLVAKPRLDPIKEKLLLCLLTLCFAKRTSGLASPFFSFGGCVGQTFSKLGMLYWLWRQREIEGEKICELKLGTFLHHCNGNFYFIVYFIA